MKRALQVASVASMIDQFTMLNIKVLQEMGYEVDVAANFEFGSTSSNDRVNKFKEELVEKKIDFTNILFDRNVFSKQNIKAYQCLKELIVENNYEIIHCHSPIGGVLTRLASRSARKKGTKVVYTAHGFHFFKGTSIKNWLLYFPVEWLCSFFTDILITINQEDYEIAKKFFKSKKITLVPGVGVDTEYIRNLEVNKEKYLREFSIPAESKIILSVGELSDRKNHRVIIQALSKINNNHIFYIICGKGDLYNELSLQAKSLGLQENVIFAGFRTDVKEIYQIADMFIFPSKQEGLPVALMEAISVGLPCVASKIRGNVDLIAYEDLYLVEKNDVSKYAEIISRRLSSSLNHKVKDNNKSKFDIECIEENYIHIYSSLAGKK